jgi:hypothetical protein
MVVTGVIDATWGGLDVAATGRRARRGVIDATWGGLDVAATVGSTARPGVIDATWGGLVVEATSDDIGAAVYAPDGVTWLANVSELIGPKWRDELSKTGAADLALPLTDPAAAHMADRSIVKYAWRGRTRFGALVSAENCSHAVDGQVMLSVNGARGLLALLADGGVLPDGGLQDDSPATRYVGFMSARAAWYRRSDWVRPVGYRMSNDTTHRVGLPAEMLKDNPWWIAPPPGPAASQPAGAIVYYRREFTTTAPITLEAVLTGDNALTFYVDGQQLINPNFSTIPFTWRQVYTVQFTLQPGAHVMAAKIENVKGVGGNPLGLVGNIYLLNNKGERIGLWGQTDLTHWWASSQPVGWFPAQILHQLMLEAQADGTAGPSALHLGFTPLTDSAGVAWSGDRQDIYALDVGKPLDQVASALTESGMDVAVDAQSMTLNAWTRRGHDLSGSVALALGDAGGNLIGFDTSKSSTRATVATAQLQDGTWLTVTDTAGVAAVGRIRVFVSLGSATSPAAAEATLRQMLATSATPTVTSTADLDPTSGPQLYRAVNLGDSVSTPGHREVGTIKQRVLAVTVDGAADIVKTSLELAVDPT